MGLPLTERRNLALVVDDDPFIQDLVRTVLQERGFEVCVANDGKAGVSMYQKHPDVSLIVTDILMPGGDGIDLILQIRRGTATATQPKIIAMSGGGVIGAEMYLESASGLGADATIEKPFSVSDLTEALSRLGF